MRSRDGVSVEESEKALERLEEGPVGEQTDALVAVNASGPVRSEVRARQTELRALTLRQVLLRARLIELNGCTVHLHTTIQITHRSYVLYRATLQTLCNKYSNYSYKVLRDKQYIMNTYCNSHFIRCYLLIKAINNRQKHHTFTQWQYDLLIIVRFRAHSKMQRESLGCGFIILSDEVVSWMGHWPLSE